MTIYPNPNCRKVRGSHVLAVSCAHCKTFIANYQKVGESNFVKMYNDRIIDGVLDFSQHHVLAPSHFDQNVVCKVSIYSRDGCPFRLYTEIFTLR